MIFAWEQDGVNTQGYVKPLSLLNRVAMQFTCVCRRFSWFDDPNTNWNGNRSRKQFMNVMVDTLATYGNVPVPATDVLFSQCGRQACDVENEKSMNIPSASSKIYDYGIRRLQIHR